MAAFSSTSLAALSVSTGTPTANSLLSSTAMVKACVVVLLSLEVAWTTTVQLLAVSASSAIAVRTTPVVVSIAKRPPALSNNE